MNVKKAIKKVAALGVGITMMGATLLGAAAADLGEYPAPFVNDGQFNGLMVVGDDAAPKDIIGVTDIAIALQYGSTTTKTVETGGVGSVSVEGDAVKFERSGDMLELNEYLGDVVETFDSSDAEGLKGFSVSNSKGSTDVNQYLRFKWTSTTANATVKYTQDDDDMVGDFLFFNEGDYGFQYEMEFEEGFESDVTATTYDLLDLEDETLNVLGEDFAVTNAVLSGSSKEKLKLELMGGSVHDTLEEGETRTYTVDGKDYEVTVLIVTDSTSTPYTKFKVNGQVTKQLASGGTEVLSDGTSLGIREILPNEAGETAGGDLVEFYIGANKVVLEGADDTAFTPDVGEESIEDAYVTFDFTNTANDTVKLHKITWKLAVDGMGGDEPYISAGHGLREVLDEPEGMWSSSWDVAYEGLTEPGISELAFKARGDDEYRFDFENNQGIEYSIPIYYASAASSIQFGDDGDALIVSQGTNTSAVGEYTANKNDYVVLTHGGTTDTGVTRVLRFESIDTSNDQVQLTDAGNGGQVTAIYTADGTAVTGCEESGSGVVNVGGYSFDFNACYNGSQSGDDKYKLLADLDDSGAVGGVANIVINGGAIITLPTPSGINTSADATMADGNFTIKTLSENFDDQHDSADELITVGVSVASTTLDLDVQDSTTYGLAMKTHDDNNDLKTGMSNYGVFFKEMNEDNDPDSLEIEYPLQQRMAQVFLTFEGASVKEGGAAGTVTYEVPNRIEVGSSILASQVSDAAAANIISVGGSCVNEVTAELLGLPYPSCGEASGLMEGEGVIKLVENGDKVAIIVAGWDAEDTTRATRVLADWSTWQEAGKLVGSEVKVSGTSLTNFDVTPVALD